MRWVVCALLATALLVDPFADAAFDAPKRLAFALFPVAATLALPWRGVLPWQLATTPAARGVLALALFAAVGSVLSCAIAPQPEQAWPALRMLGFALLYLLLGASATMTGTFGVQILRVGMLAAALLASLSLLQAAGVALPLPTQSISGRFDTGALLGNEGYISLAAALLGAAGAAIVLNTRNARARLLALGCLLLALACIVANRQSTSLIALAAAIVGLLLLRWRAGALIGIGAMAGLAFAIAACVPTLRAVVVDDSQATIDHWQERTTFRLSAYASALHMIDARPWSGHGLGSYALRSTQHRLAAEIEHQRRWRTPVNASSFAATHNEYLQLAAEAGLPVLACVLSALVMLLLALLRVARAADALEARLLLALLIVGGVSALAWFPLQIPFTAVVLLLALGRAWRLVATPVAHKEQP